MQKLKVSLLTACLLSLVLMSCYFFYKTIFVTQIAHPHDTLNPDVTIYELTSLNFGKDGNPSIKLIAPIMNYNSYTQNAVFTKPTIFFYSTNQKNDAPWVITADTSTVTQQPKIYKLIGNVFLNQGATTTTQSTQIMTSELTIDPVKHLAHTNKFITFVQIDKNNSKITVNSMGAIANQKTGEVKLLSNARGHYNAK